MDARADAQADAPPIPATPLLSVGERRYRLVEFIALFGVMPGLFAVGNVKALFLLLMSAMGVCLGLLLLDRSFDRRQLWNAPALGPALPRILALWGVGVVVLGGIVLLLEPGWFLAFPRERPWLWLAVMLLYPVLSVYPQNVVYRTFIMHRYRAVFPSDTAILWASALAFSWGHVIFRNPVALALTLAGGLIFAHTYQRTRSTLAVSVEHALYGCAVFTLGLGRALYLGAN